jgi:hypothetical protein
METAVPIQSRLRQVAVTVSIMPDTVDTVIWAPDDGWRYHPKYVQQFTDINKLYIVASCWIIIATYYTMHGPLNIKFFSFQFSSCLLFDFSNSIQDAHVQHCQKSTHIWVSKRLLYGLVKSAEPPGHSLRGVRRNTYYSVLMFVLWTF